MGASRIASHGSMHRPRSRRGERAQSEVALMLPLILILVIGVIEVSNALNAYISVVNAARDGARIGSKGGATDPQIQALVQRDLQRLPQTVPTSNITITYPVVSGVNAVKVKACYDHKLLLKVPIVMPSSFTMCSDTTMPKLN
jgi:Flp pilus assembly protein TadG